ncbi:peptidoglycan recognition protein family protein [Streptomyces sp.]|uniref:peptidoglycan recognition protein family protein n=1 Tax=Streptomyces sp. TaxID=1931 RepID=UPI002F3E465A
MSAQPAFAATPTIYDCAAWGAKPPSAPVSVLASRPDKIIVHHTAGANSTDYSLAHAFTVARQIQDFHMTGNGWIDSGQHFTNSRGGYVLEGRHESLNSLVNGGKHVVSAHCTGQNNVAVGIENEGTYTTVAPTAQQYAKLVDLCAYIARQYGLRAYQIWAHRDFNNTQCCGDVLYSMLPQLRRDVAAQIGGDPAAPVWPVLQSGNTGESVRTLQYLLRYWGSSITADGSYGPATQSAVTSFQSARKAVADGIAGNQTWNQAVLNVSLGQTGEAVKAVQSQLSAHGIPTTVDGVFGSGTQSGVKTFQSSRSLPVDGLVDARTWDALLG